MLPGRLVQCATLDLDAATQSDVAVVCEHLTSKPVHKTQKKQEYSRSSSTFTINASSFTDLFASHLNPLLSSYFLPSFLLLPSFLPSLLPSCLTMITWLMIAVSTNTSTSTASVHLTVHHVVYIYHVMSRRVTSHMCCWEVTLVRAMRNHKR